MTVKGSLGLYCMYTRKEYESYQELINLTKWVRELVTA